MSVVFKLEPQTWIEDPLTGRNEKVKYRAITTYPVTCPHCQVEIHETEVIKTKNFLILNCSLCNVYTWLKIK